MKTRIQSAVKRALPTLALIHPRNHTSVERESYPQLWYCWPRWTKWKLFYAVRTRLCGWFTGHELSKTEWGYGGGSQVDHRCRWCDLLIRIPKAESPAPAQISDIARDELGF